MSTYIIGNREIFIWNRIMSKYHRDPWSANNDDPPELLRLEVLCMGVTEKGRMHPTNQPIDFFCFTTEPWLTLFGGKEWARARLTLPTHILFRM